jgi:hypothetical protein
MDTVQVESVNTFAQVVEQGIERLLASTEGLGILLSGLMGRNGGWDYSYP